MTEKWIKIKVPENFDSNNIHIIHNGSETLTEIWEPQYRQVLNSGYIGLIDFMGDDNSIVQAARTSYGKGTTRKNTDTGLIRYLMRHRHTTPFEMVEFKFHVKAPIFVFRQWHRHRTASINEYSARYSELEDDFYYPDIENIGIQSSTNKQGRENETLTFEEYQGVYSVLNHIFDDSYQGYLNLLGQSFPPDGIEQRRTFLEQSALEGLRAMSDRGTKELLNADYLDFKIKEYFEAQGFNYLNPETFQGISRELARIILPVATYSQMYWKSNLKNILHFINLRSDPHAQYEIKAYSDTMMEIIKPFVPISVQAFLDYEKNGGKFSNVEMELIKSLLKDFDQIEIENKLKNNGCSSREIQEFITKII